MAEKGRFIIRRNDQVARADDVIIESEGLTLGRVVGNDLVLNHRSVSRTHAGIKQLGGEYWLFNLSTSNGTLLNGQLVARAPIADGDTLQIGPYFLKTNYVGGGLTIAVEIALGMQPVEGPASQPQGGSVDEATVFIDLRQVASGLAGGATARFGGASGLLTGVLPALDEQALNVFWEKRKREAGKLAAKTLLHPKGGRGVGKAQFNWRPTLDLRGLWRKSYFAWGVMLVGAVSIAAIAAQSIYYSPGRLSDSHASSSVSAAGIALTPNANSCFSCHSVTVTMQQNCVK
ncbi:MAG TPA: FHA domain-containing protein, partial [Blastocatellia bacterium]|nr:FHA domain-containing protein [Blastocatellia bacterium]